MNINLPPLYTIAYDGKDIPGIVHAISKCVFEEGFTIVDVSVASGVSIYKLFITCHRRTDARSEPVEPSELGRGIADEAWLQTRIQKMLGVHYKDYYHRILDERPPSALGQVSVHRHMDINARWAISLTLQFGGTVGTLAAITGILSFYININDMMVESIAETQGSHSGIDKFIFIFHIQASLLPERVYEPHDRDRAYLQGREEAAKQSLPAIVTEPLEKILPALKAQLENALLSEEIKIKEREKLDRAEGESEKTLWAALMSDDEPRRKDLLDAQRFVVTSRNKARHIKKEQDHARRIAHALYDLLAWTFFAFPDGFYVRRLDVGYQSPHSQYGSGITWNPSVGRTPIPYSVESPTL